MVFRSKQPILAVIVAFIMTSCQLLPPQYETIYSYKPPEDADGRSCIVNCDIIKSQCDEIDRLHASQRRLEKDSCEVNAKISYQNCITAGGEGAERECERPSCSHLAPTPRSQDCVGHYNRCFTACGGAISRETRCIGRCP